MNATFSFGFQSKKATLCLFATRTLVYFDFDSEDERWMNVDFLYLSGDDRLQRYCLSICQTIPTPR
jgi:hypothetical protein